MAMAFPQAPTSPSSPRRGGSLASIAQRIYLMGGEGSDGFPVSSMRCYDLAEGVSWLCCAMPEPRVDVVAVRFQQMIFVLGGCLSNGSWTSSVISYDPVQDVWTEQPPMPQTPVGAAVFVGTLSF
eukprot:TRINITY_DN6475_c0_g1_i1.p1 TRINITY_DN6475_c0_g1~~TRINITY_DN6475_c0_g1_i1.p1  ORF type:complete len:145 (-),score=22.90 TRINITY_DN6475_c0_g1_i1:87-461(-)